ncbi:hypothetical protein [Priestia taiwanensis]|uniref:Uncharacterized protein n=1 Tax=Priestia taiwanensis TaxID=1347902 RepID=A0A917AWJ8_9BACI|nr:hypothetical protein [Priestia taiwanensis]MBM7364937.1 hypothetical protein [Priestia taiwanensis]GGE82384.1 hypothetical protein GCM10007140_35050 [Priestia taiwanensis]
MKFNFQVICLLAIICNTVMLYVGTTTIAEVILGMLSVLWLSLFMKKNRNKENIFK